MGLAVKKITVPNLTKRREAKTGQGNSTIHNDSGPPRTHLKPSSYHHITENHMTPEYTNIPTIDHPCHPKPIYSIQTYLEALRHVDCTHILDRLSHPQSTGRPLAPRAPMVQLYLLSRSPLTNVPQKMDALEEWLKEDRNGLATLCGFDRISGNRTLRGVFRELDELENEVSIVQLQVKSLLKGQRAKTTRKARGKPTAIRSGRFGTSAKKGRKRNRHWTKAEDYRKFQLKGALGIMQFADMFPHEKAAEEFIIDSRWPDGAVECPEPDCGSRDVTEPPGCKRYKRRTWSCRACGRRFNALTCTTLQGIHGSWRTILLAVYLTLQFDHHTGLTLACALKTDERTHAHHTALELKHRIYQAMEEELPPFSGTCQADDTLIGNVNATPILVIACKENESGAVKAKVIIGEMELAKSIPFFEYATTDKAMLLTDETDKYPFGLRVRLTVNHSEHEYVRRDDVYHVLVTTNAVESFWATLKALLRAHHAVTLRHLYLYVAAAAWHISHLGESTVDQMRALIHNSHSALVRPASEKPEDMPDLQLKLQKPKRDRKAVSGREHHPKERPPKNGRQLKFNLPRAEAPCTPGRRSARRRRRQ